MRPQRRCDRQVYVEFLSWVVAIEFKITGDCCVLKFLRGSEDGKYLMRFQNKTSVLKFLRRSIDGASGGYSKPWRQRRWERHQTKVRMSKILAAHVIFEPWPVHFFTHHLQNNNLKWPKTCFEEPDFFVSFFGLEDHWTSAVITYSCFNKALAALQADFFQKSPFGDL